MCKEHNLEITVIDPKIEAFLKFVAAIKASFSQWISYFSVK